MRVCTLYRCLDHSLTASRHNEIPVRYRKNRRRRRARWRIRDTPHSCCLFFKTRLRRRTGSAFAVIQRGSGVVACFLSYHFLSRYCFLSYDFLSGSGVVACFSRPGNLLALSTLNRKIVIPFSPLCARRYDYYPMPLPSWVD
jgi:hypothetical protein